MAPTEADGPYIRSLGGTVPARCPAYKVPFEAAGGEIRCWVPRAELWRPRLSRSRGAAADEFSAVSCERSTARLLLPFRERHLHETPRGVCRGEQTFRGFKTRIREPVKKAERKIKDPRLTVRRHVRKSTSSGNIA